jgi:hypothetical protein
VTFPSLLVGVPEERRDVSMFLFVDYLDRVKSSYLSVKLYLT